MAVRIFGTLSYSILVGCAWSLLFRKKFSSSLAPAFLTHIIITLLSGMIFKNHSVGIIGGIVLAVLVLVYSLVKDTRKGDKVSVGTLFSEMADGGLLMFLLFYVFCIVVNSGKRFIYPDEFSHWGLFLKESLRTDQLYCMSPVNIWHKDYVPAVTLFEVIWCRIGFRFSESDAYRAIQIFMFSLLMPVFEVFNAHLQPGKHKGVSLVGRIKYRLERILPVVVVLLIPLIFNTSSAFLFFHSIYLDLAAGIVFFYCLFEAMREYDSDGYQCLILTIASIVLVMTKMTMMALLPLLIALILGKMIFVDDKRGGKRFLFVIPPVVLPVLTWYAFNRFVAVFVDNTGNIQSYSGMSLSSVKDVFTDPSRSTIPYLQEVRDNFVYALFHRDILIHGSFLATLIFLVIGFFVLAHLSEKKSDKNKLVLFGVWTFFSGAYYALLMYFLYSTAFIEYEAVRLASYERYFNSFMIAPILMLVASYFATGIWVKHKNGYYIMAVLLAADLAFLHASAFDQIMPNVISHDSEVVAPYMETATRINDLTPEACGIVVIRRGDDSAFLYRLRYYCSPRTIEGCNYGPPAYDGDAWSIDISPEEFLDVMGRCEYIAFSEVDDKFIEKYSCIFEDPSLIQNGAFYRILGVDDRVRLGELN